MEAVPVEAVPTHSTNVSLSIHVWRIRQPTQRSKHGQSRAGEHAGTPKTRRPLIEMCTPDGGRAPFGARMERQGAKAQRRKGSEQLILVHFFAPLRLGVDFPSATLVTVA